MTALVGGIVALVLGIIGIILWWSSFLTLLAGGVPLALVLGGALATYLGIEEYKDKLERSKMEEPLPSSSTDAEKYRQESDRLKQEVEELKKEIQGLKEEKSGS
jgi:predicted nuclease with TOPRIM domain